MTKAHPRAEISPDQEIVKVIAIRKWGRGGAVEETSCNKSVNPGLRRRNPGIKL